MTHVSLKAMAEGKTVGVQKTTQFKVNPKLVEIEDGFNARPLDREHLDAMKTSFKNGAIFPPIIVRVDEGRIVLVDGHHRTAMACELIDEGMEIVGIDATQFRGNDADRVAHMLTSAQGLALTPLQMGLTYNRLIGFGWDIKQIAAKTGKSISHVTDMLKLAGSNTDVQQMVNDKTVGANTALKMVKKHGEKAGKVMKEQLAASGKKKLTPKAIKSEFVSLEKAIQEEISSGGLVAAEDRCPKHAKLIAYLRSTDA